MFFRTGTEEVDLWKYEIRVSRTEFNADYGPYKGLENPWAGGECDLFKFGATGESRYIPGRGGFCVFADAFPGSQERKAIRSRLLLARFGEQVEVEIEIWPESEEGYLSVDLTVPVAASEYLEHRVAAAFSAQLDPTGAVDTQMLEQLSGGEALPGWTATPGEDWCSDLAEIEPSVFMEPERDWIRYELSPVALEDSARWGTGDSGELHCSASWLVETWIGDALDEQDPISGQAAGLSVMPWPWGAEVLQESSNSRNGYGACAQIGLEAFESDSRWSAETVARLTLIKRCHPESAAPTLLLLIDDVYLVRIWSYVWDSNGNNQRRSDWNPGVQDHLLTAFVDRLEASQR